MSNAQNYVPTTSFASEETNQASGRSTVKTVKLDTEFANISASINGVNSNLKLLQRDDGNLKDFLVRTYSLSEEVRALIASKGSPKGLWKNATAYGVGDCVEFNNVAYLCHTAHTSNLNFEFSLWTAISAGMDAVSSAQQAAEAALTAISAAQSTEAIEASLSSSLSNLANALTSIQEAKVAAENAAAIASNAANAAQSAAAAGVGVNAQPLDADLTAIAGLSGAGYPKRNPSGSWQIDQFASIADDSVTQDKLAPEIGTSATQAEMEAGSEEALRLMSPLRVKQAIVALSKNAGLFYKENASIVAFAKTGNFSVVTSTNIYVEVNGVVKTIASGTPIMMPASPVAGTDYVVWAKTNDTLEATSNFSTPPTVNARKIGGFHYAPGGNAPSNGGGSVTPQINQYSFWDLKFRPKCNDPRGMTLVADSFWVDIYLTNTNPDVNGTSKYSVTIADGASPSKIPAMFGGDGTTNYTSLTWFEACEIASSFGKRLITQPEFIAATYGTSDGLSIADVNTTTLNQALTSKWGIIQSTGMMGIWGAERGGPSGGTSISTGAVGRGNENSAPNAPYFGIVGSRASHWDRAASYSSYFIGMRCASDHLLLS